MLNFLVYFVKDEAIFLYNVQCETDGSSFKEKKGFTFVYVMTTSRPTARHRKLHASIVTSSITPHSILTTQSAIIPERGLGLEAEV